MSTDAKALTQRLVFDLARYYSGEFTKRLLDFLDSHTTPLEDSNARGIFWSLVKDLLDKMTPTSKSLVLLIDIESGKTANADLVAMLHEWRRGLPDYIKMVLSTRHNSPFAVAINDMGAVPVAIDSNAVRNDIVDFSVDFLRYCDVPEDVNLRDLANTLAGHADDSFAWAVLARHYLQLQRAPVTPSLVISLQPAWDTPVSGTDSLITRIIEEYHRQGLVRDKAALDAVLEVLARGRHNVTELAGKLKRDAAEVASVLRVLGPLVTFHPPAKLGGKPSVRLFHKVFTSFVMSRMAERPRASSSQAATSPSTPDASQSTADSTDNSGTKRTERPSGEASTSHKHGEEEKLRAAQPLEAPVPPQVVTGSLLKTETTAGETPPSQTVRPLASPPTQASAAASAAAAAAGLLPPLPQQEAKPLPPVPFHMAGSADHRTTGWHKAPLQPVDPLVPMQVRKVAEESNRFSTLSVSSSVSSSSSSDDTNVSAPSWPPTAPRASARSASSTSGGEKPPYGPWPKSVSSGSGSTLVASSPPTPWGGFTGSFSSGASKSTSATYRSLSPTVVPKQVDSPPQQFPTRAERATTAIMPSGPLDSPSSDQETVDLLRGRRTNPVNVLAYAQLQQSPSKADLQFAKTQQQSKGGDPARE
ncbi:hypothetical protein HK405_006246 [Cladochytrium tenue]|nr:hypothetical protein HK405_006246 [Cladochytrium tenue]